MKYLIVLTLVFSGFVILVVSSFRFFKAHDMAEVKDKQQILAKYDAKVGEDGSASNNASQEVVAAAVHKDELQRVDGSADKDFTKKPEPIVGGELKERRTDSELELAIISSEQENSVVDEEIYAASGVDEVEDEKQLSAKLGEDGSASNNASQEVVAAAVHKDELQRVDGSADKDFTKKPEPIVGGELKERRTDSELELAIISSEQENFVVDKKSNAVCAVAEVKDKQQILGKYDCTVNEACSVPNNASQEPVATAVHKDELQRVDGSADKDFTKKPEPIVGGELKELRTDSESDLAMISSEQENSVVDEKIDAVVLKFDLKLSQTQQSFNKTLKKQQKLIDAMALQVKNIDDQQKRTVKSTSKLKKAYVEERVRREIADEVIKKHLTTD